jgi:hypothetical protein
VRLRRVSQAGGLALIALVGFLLGSCGGGEGGTALTSRTGVTATRPGATTTRPGVTATRPAVSVPTQTVVTTASSPTVTSSVTTTETVTTVAQPTVTVAPTETQITVTVPTQPTETSAPPPPVEPTAEPSDDTTAAWLVLVGALLAVVGAIAFALWWRGRSHAEDAWSAQLADLARRTLVALDAVLAEGSLVTGQVEALAAEARGLEARSPDDAAQATSGQLRARLDELAGTLQTDRALRLGTPPPSSEQLAYSTALIRLKAGELEAVLRPPPGSYPGGGWPAG